MSRPPKGGIILRAGAIKIEHHGTQNHSFSTEEFRERYLASFDEEL